MKRVGVLDYGSGNLHSVVRALGEVGTVAVLVSDPVKLADFDALVIPGVGAFHACMEQLTQIGGDQMIRDWALASRPMLAICVGHQVLFSEGTENGCTTQGVGLLHGTVEQLPTRRLPHMGWDTVIPPPTSRFFTSTTQRYYFVHSYAVLETSGLPDDALVTWGDHDGARFVAAVETASLLSTQFHPEKSGPVGLSLLATWAGGL